MSAKGFKRMLLGEKMPDKDDPKYKERYERDLAAGQKFARWSRLDRLVGHIQRFANNHRNTFLAMVFVFVAVSIGYNIYRLSCVYSHRPSRHSVIEMQDSVLRAKRHGVLTNKMSYDNDNSRD